MTTDSKPPYFYTLYGLTIKSDLALRDALELAAIDGEADVTIRRAETRHADETVEPQDAPALQYRSDGTLEMIFEQVGHYTVSSSEITISPVVDASDDILRLPILGLVLSAVLVQRGLSVLHASAIQVGGEAVAFIGDKRFGKSTMAAALVQRGHRLISDDVVVLDARKPAGWAVRPGPFGVKLWPDAIESFGIPPEAHYPLYEGATKRIFDTRDRHVTKPVPLQRMYVLGRGEQVQLEPISASYGLIELLRNAFVSRYPSVDENAPSKLLERYGPIRRTVDMKILRRPVDKGLLTKVAEAIEADVQLHPAPAQ